MAEGEYAKSSFNFDQGTLGVNLATLPDKVDRFITDMQDIGANLAEITMKEKAPWTQTGMANRWGRISTGKARDGLWADPWGTSERGGVQLGHSVYYGEYLENNFGGRYQIIAPVMVQVARRMMESFEEMFAQLEAHAPPDIGVMPDVGVRQGTSQSIGDKVKRRTGIQFRDSKGRFTSVKNATKSKARGIKGAITKAAKRSRNT